MPSASSSVCACPQPIVVPAGRPADRTPDTTARAQWGRRKRVRGVRCALHRHLITRRRASERANRVLEATADAATTVSLSVVGTMSREDAANAAAVAYGASVSRLVPMTTTSTSSSSAQADAGRMLSAAVVGNTSSSLRPPPPAAAAAAAHHQRAVRHHHPLHHVAAVHRQRLLAAAAQRHEHKVS